MSDHEFMADVDTAAGRGHDEPWMQGPDGIRCPSPARARAFLGLIRAGAALDHGLDRDLRRAHGIGLRAYEVLLHLAMFARDCRSRITQLSAQAPLSQSRMSRLVDELEAAGLVEREAFEGDRRGVTVAITAAGLDRLREVQDSHHRSLEERFFSRLSHDQLLELTAITDALLEDDPDTP